MTYNEYIMQAGVYDPATIFATIPAVNSVAFNDLFVAHYGRRECCFDDVTDFGNSLKIYAAINCDHFRHVLAALTEANAAAIGNLTRQTKLFAAPNGDVDDAYTDSMSQEEILHDKTDLQKLTAYMNDVKVKYMELLESFEPLFIGVI